MQDLHAIPIPSLNRANPAPFELGGLATTAVCGEKDSKSRVEAEEQGLVSRLFSKVLRTGRYLRWNSRMVVF